ncbi:hypothetical protein E2C01_090197 [Portunus trituberculatus]|uniref:Uncharacterized protein n=1 Tax=Portunus trituberculatus TaxID=210409 RepID=A0A5B7JK98_PORTR|nr:hypothetical protein [Portunus trituberculatus]
MDRVCLARRHQSRGGKTCFVLVCCTLVSRVSTPRSGPQQSPPKLYSICGLAAGWHRAGSVGV